MTLVVLSTRMLIALVPRRRPGSRSGDRRVQCNLESRSFASSVQTKPPAPGPRPSPGNNLVQASVDLLARFEQLLHRVYADVEIVTGRIVQFDLDDLLDPARAEHAGHADVQIIHAILA